MKHEDIETTLAASDFHRARCLFFFLVPPIVELICGDATMWGVTLLLARLVSSSAQRRLFNERIGVRRKDDYLMSESGGYQKTSETRAM